MFSLNFCPPEEFCKTEESAPGATSGSLAKRQYQPAKSAKKCDSTATKRRALWSVALGSANLVAGVLSESNTFKPRKDAYRGRDLNRFGNSIL